MCGEEFGQGGAGRLGHAPALARSARERTRLSRSGACGDGSAGDQRQTSCHTTHNAFVLLLFFLPRLAGKSQWRDSRVTPSSSKNTLISCATSRTTRIDTPMLICVHLSSTALSRSCSKPRAERGATIPSRRDQRARCGTGGFSVIRGIGGSSTL